MTVPLNETHDPARRSFVGSANAADCEFPIQNLPFGVFRPTPGASPRVGVAIGDQILDVAAAASSFAGHAVHGARAGVPVWWAGPSMLRAPAPRPVSIR